MVRSPVLLVIPLLASCGGEPVALGAEGGRLTPCPDTPNCVSTREDEDDGHRIDPIPFAGSAEEAMIAITETVEGMPRTEVVGREGDYLRAEFTSRIFRFVDDVEFWVDGEEGLIHFRSVSRVGRSDMGVSRERMTKITMNVEAKLGN